jgi:pyrroline-5-carboxylate reductase
MKTNLKISILGGGNLGVAMAEGLLKNAGIKPGNLTVTRRRTELIEYLKSKKVKVIRGNCEAVSLADVVIITVKPHQAEGLLKEIKSSLKPGKHLLISAVTGLSIQRISSITGSKIPVLRIMPNTAVAIGESVICIAGTTLNPAADQIAETILGTLGKTLVIPEELMEAATVLGACGVAFAMRFLRALTQGGIEIGFSAKTAQDIAAQTMLGAAALIMENGQHPEQEIDKVTTPMGITISGLNEMEHNGFSSALIKGLVTSYNKISNMNK